VLDPAPLVAPLGMPLPAGATLLGAWAAGRPATLGAVVAVGALAATSLRLRRVPPSRTGHLRDRSPSADGSGSTRTPSSRSATPSPPARPNSPASAGQPPRRR